MDARADRVWFAACAAVYLAIATRLTDGLGRTQFDNSAFAHFFDFQTEALLRGDLALEQDSIGLEAFVVDGQDHMYFGLFPALLRMPVAVLTDRFFGHLTVVSSFGAWLLFVLAAWKLTDAVVSDPSGPLVRVWKVGAALGTPMLALAGSAWVFNEAIMWGVASCVWFQYRLLREMQASSAGNQYWLAASLLLVVLNRPTFGLGCLVVTASVVVGRSWRTRTFGVDAARQGAAVVVGAVVLVAPNMARFGRLFGPPMESQGLSTFDAHRMRMLEYTGGDYVDPRYLPTNLLAYLRPDGVSVGSRFPFVTAPDTIPANVGGVVHDITYRTPSLTASTPFLVVLAVVGLVAAVRAASRRDVGSSSTHLLVLAATGAPAAAALTVWGFIAPRYLGDFVPLLVPLALLGLTSIASDPARWVVIVVSLLTTWSVASSAGVALSTSYERGYDGDVAEYLDLQGRGDVWDDGIRFDSPSQFEFDRNDPPTAGQVAVLADCEAAYFSTGEQVDPWLAVGYGPNDFRREFEVIIGDDVVSASVGLARLTAVRPTRPDEPDDFEVILRVDGDTVAIELADRFGAVPYVLDDIGPGARFVLGVTSDPVREVLTFEVDGRAIGYGHVFTRSLYGPSGQTVSFAESVATDGIGATALAASPRC